MSCTVYWVKETYIHNFRYIVTICATEIRGLEIKRKELLALSGEIREGFLEEVAFKFILEGPAVFGCAETMRTYSRRREQRYKSQEGWGV